MAKSKYILYRNTYLKAAAIFSAVLIVVGMIGVAQF